MLPLFWSFWLWSEAVRGAEEGSASAEKQTVREKSKGEQEEGKTDLEEQPVAGNAAPQLEGKTAHGATQRYIFDQPPATGGWRGQRSQGYTCRDYLTISQLPSGCRQAVP